MSLGVPKNRCETGCRRVEPWETATVWDDRTKHDDVWGHCRRLRTLLN